MRSATAISYSIVLHDRDARHVRTARRRGSARCGRRESAVREAVAAKPRAGARRRLAAALAWPCGPRPLRCSLAWPRRRTRCVRCALYAQTAATSQLTWRAARAGHASCAPRRRRCAPPGTRPRLCEPTASLLRGLGAKWASSPHRARRSARQAGSMPELRLPSTKTRALLAKPWPGGGRSASAAPSSAAARGRARSALREQTRRDCPSVESAANAASFAAGHEARAAQGTWPAGPRTSRS